MTINKKNIVIIESNTTGTGDLFLKNIIEKNYNVIFLTKNPAKYSFLEDRLIHPIRIDTSDIPALIEFIKNLSDVKAVFTTSEFFIETCAKIAGTLGLLHNTLDCINTCRNKDKLYSVLQANDISVPETFIVNSPAELSIENLAISLPLILKPASGSGSIGVKLCKTKEEVLQHATLLLESNKVVLMQQYIEGDEYSVESISIDGKHHIIGITYPTRSR